MSTPLPLMVYTLLPSYEADPARAGLPTSVSVHGDGSVASAAADCAPRPQSPVTTIAAAPSIARYFRTISFPRVGQVPPEVGPGNSLTKLSFFHDTFRMTQQVSKKLKKWRVLTTCNPTTTWF